jgi:[ribosomal protein S5]-alanine N-acetyltransferase
MNAFHYLDSVDVEDPLSLTIAGKRVQLVTISNQFDQDIFREFTEEVTLYMFPSPAKEIKETRCFITESRQAIQAGYNLQFAILSKTDEFLGCCGLHGEENVRTPELGIWLKKGAHGMGYGREAIHTLVDWARRNIDIDAFIYPVDRRNIPSRKIPESLNGKIIEEAPKKTPNRKFLNLIVYRIEGTRVYSPSTIYQL